METATLLRQLELDYEVIFPFIFQRRFYIFSTDTDTVFAPPVWQN